MKTFNNHPQWHDEPLRLTQEEIQRPELVITAFFEGYHLQEVREIFWNWMVTVITSKGSISQEPTDRSNHIYFYEEIEKLVEATYVIHQARNCKERPLF